MDSGFDESEEPLFTADMVCRRVLIADPSECFREVKLRVHQRH